MRFRFVFSWITQHSWQRSQWKGFFVGTLSPGSLVAWQLFPISC